MKIVALLFLIGMSILLAIGVVGFHLIKELIKSTKYFFKK